MDVPRSSGTCLERCNGPTPNCPLSTYIIGCCFQGRDESRLLLGVEKPTVSRHRNLRPSGRLPFEMAALVLLLCGVSCGHRHRHGAAECLADLLRLFLSGRHREKLTRAQSGRVLATAGSTRFPPEDGSREPKNGGAFAQWVFGNIAGGANPSGDHGG